MTTMRELNEAVRRGNFVVLDTETSGLEKPAEIIQVAIVDFAGHTILNTLVDPKGDISADAHRVHGITKVHTSGAPTWVEVKSQVQDIIRGHDVVVYNAVFDRKLMHWSDEEWGLPQTDYVEHSSWFCAMLAYAEFWAERHSYYGSYVWQKLQNACEQQGIMASNQHSAIGDAFATWFLVQHICRVYSDKLSFNQLTGTDQGPLAPPRI
jgi:DNA polymerase-3 subunit epsilon